MEFTVETSKLEAALEQIQGAVDRKNTTPILSHCLVEAESRGLRLTATDLEVGIACYARRGLRSSRYKVRFDSFSSTSRTCTGNVAVFDSGVGEPIRVISIFPISSPAT